MLNGLILIGTLQVIIAVVVILMCARLFMILREVKRNVKKK